MRTLVRPRSASLLLELDADGRPRDSDLVLTTRDGEVVWRGQVGADAWRAGVRLRSRCQGTWQDAHWLLTRTLLETELATHGLSRDGVADLDVDMRTGSDGGLTLTTLCRVIPAPPYPLLQDTTIDALTWHRARSTVAAGALRPGAPAGGVPDPGTG